MRHVYALIPCDDMHSDVEGCDYSLVDAAAVAQSTTPRYILSGMRHPFRSRRTNR
jgi:hypothetical protein